MMGYEKNLDELMETYIRLSKWDLMQQALDRVETTYSKHRHYSVIKTFLENKEKEQLNINNYQNGKTK